MGSQSEILARGIRDLEQSVTATKFVAFEQNVTDTEVYIGSGSTMYISFLQALAAVEIMHLKPVQSMNKTCL